MKRNCKSISGLTGAIALAVCGIVPAHASPVYSTTVLSQSPPAYYTLSENVQPQPPAFATNYGSFSASQNGTYFGAPTLNLPGPFAGSVAGYFDSTSSSNCVVTPWVSGVNTKSFSFEIWVNSSYTGSLGVLASSEETGGNRSGWLLSQDNANNYGAGKAWVVRLYNQNALTSSLQLAAPITSTNWIDLVVSFNGTNGYFYTNGVLANTAVATGYVPDSQDPSTAANVPGPLTLGLRSDSGFPWAGSLAKPALYGSALSAARVAAHYSAAIHSPATYDSTVLADSPYVYYEAFAAPPSPIAYNLGTDGSAENGLYVSDTVPGGEAGPTPPAEPGFSPTNLAPVFDGGGGVVSLPALNFNTNVLTISGWVNASASEPIGAGLVVCDGGPTAAGLIMDGENGGFGLGYIWNNDGQTYGTSFTASFGLPQLNQGEWDFVALVVETNQAEIYISSPTIPFTSATNYYPNVNQTFGAPMTIGADPGDLTAPSPIPASAFSGGISSVGIWNRPLSSGELYTEYASAVGGLAPKIFGDPVSPAQPIVQGNPLTLSVNSGGTPNLSYQWYVNNVPIAGATSNVYLKPGFSIAADTGSYYVIVTNLFGSATSGVANVTGQLGTAPVIASLPSGATVYPGGSFSLTVGATGGGLAYQWSLNGTPIAGATEDTYAVTSVAVSNAGSYLLSVTNSLGKASAGPFVITVPTLVKGTYAQVVDADAPESWWRLNDTNASTGALLNDVMNRHYGTYTNLGGLTLRNPGAVYSGQSLAGSAASFSGDGSFGYIPYFADLDNSPFTLEAWVKQPPTEANDVVLGTGDTNNNDYGITAGFVASGEPVQWFGLAGPYVFGYAPGEGQPQENANYSPNVSNVWTHIAIIYNPKQNANAPWSIYINGVTDDYLWPAGSPPLGQPLIIGGLGTGDSSVLSSFFTGSVQEVAFYNKVLSQSNLQAHYTAATAGQPPYFVQQPLSQGAIAGQNVTLSASVTGSGPIAFQWEENGAQLLGQTNDSYTVTNVFYTGNSNVFAVVATNSYGAAISSNAVITAFYPPTYANLTNGLVLHLTFDGNYQDTSGQGNNGTPVGSPTFVSGVVGSQAVDLLTEISVTSPAYNYVSLGNPSELQFGASQNFSCSYWVKMPAGAKPFDLPFLANAIGSTYSQGLVLAPTFETGGWAWTVVDENTNTAAGVGADGSINDGKWHNVVEVFVRTNACTTYLDGKLVDSTSITNVGNINTGNSFTIGQDPTGTYNGNVTNLTATFDLDDVGVWSRALSNYEAESIYPVGLTYGKSFNTDSSATVAIYKLAGGAGIAWESGTLVKSGSVNGPWTPVIGATPPFYQIPASSTNVFYGVGVH